MTLHQLGETEQARTYYDKLVKDQDARDNPSEKLKQLRAQAAALLAGQQETDDPGQVSR